MMNHKPATEILTALTGKNYIGESYWTYYNTKPYQMLEWMCSGGNSAIETLIAHFQMAKAIIEYGKSTFYASDLPLDSARHYINGLSVNRLIHKTGNTKYVFVPMGEGGYGKMCETYEWELTMEPEDFANTFYGLRTILLEKLMDI